MKKEVPPEVYQEKQDNMEKKMSEPYYVEYLMHYYQHDRHKRRFRLAIPETCIFEKGFPVSMISKKKVEDACDLGTPSDEDREKKRKA